MRPSLLLFGTALALATAAGRAPAQSAPLKGQLTDVTKDENAPTGSVTVTAGGKATKFVVDAGTKFEFVRGKEKKPTTFLAEHQGEQVAVVGRAGSNPPAAALVQIILPPPPPPGPGHLHWTPPGPGHLRGTVETVDPGKLVIRVKNAIPPAPVQGTITDVTKSETDDTGSLTVKSSGGDKKFVVNSVTAFNVVQNDATTGSSFLTDHKGLTAVVFPRWGQESVAARVDVVAAGSSDKAAAKAAYRHTHTAQDHPVTFSLAADTKYAKVRDGKHTAASLADVKPGEEVSVLPQKVRSHKAANVDVLLPHAVHGTVASASAGSLAVKVHKAGAADATVQIPLTGATKIESVAGATHNPAGTADLKPGVKVAVFPDGVPPHAADAVEIHLGPTKTVTAKGTVASVGGGVLVVQTAKGPQTFRLADGTKFVTRQGKETRPATAADLKPKGTVTVSGTGSPPVADTVEVQPPSKPGDNAKKAQSGQKKTDKKTK